MTEQSRRQFIQSCLCFTLSGLSPTFVSLCTGCKKNEKSTSLPDVLEYEKEERLVVERAAKIDPNYEPAYLKLHRTGELKKRGEERWNIMESCKLCPRMCGVNRLAGEKGFCQATSKLFVASYHPHFGEERSLVGRGGSGAIFFSNCGLRCVFCINWEISQGGKGKLASIEELAQMMLSLQKRGCHNINLVSPTHYSAHILLAVDIAAGKGLRLPLVYNTCGWERLEIIKMFDGIIDIYLPDFKYGDGKMAAKHLSAAVTYPEITGQAILEMQRQVGVARPAKDGLMFRGLMIRHLVMPNRVAGTKEIIEWIAQNLPKNTYFNIMQQYTPTHKAFEYPEISRRITQEEFKEAVRWAKATGLTNLDIQGWR